MTDAKFLISWLVGSSLLGFVEGYLIGVSVKRWFWPKETKVRKPT